MLTQTVRPCVVMLQPGGSFCNSPVKLLEVPPFAASWVWLVLCMSSTKLSSPDK